MVLRRGPFSWKKALIERAHQGTKKKELGFGAHGPKTCTMLFHNRCKTLFPLDLRVPSVGAVGGGGGGSRVCLLSEGKKRSTKTRQTDP